MMQPMIRTMFSWTAAFTLALAVVLSLVLPRTAAAATATPTVTTEQVRAELLLYAPQGLQPGQRAWLGLKIEHRPGWHTYWLNPGDSGLPTSLQWQLPPGLQAGDIQWPVPHRLPIGPLMNHGYEGLLLLPVPLQVTRELGVGSLVLKLRADWLVCKDVCIPEGGDFTLMIPPGAAQASRVGASALFEQAFSRLPTSAPSVQAAATVQRDGLELTVQALPAEWKGRRLAVFPETPHILAPAAEPVARWGARAGAGGMESTGGTGSKGGASAEDTIWTARLAYSPQRVDGPTEMAFVLAPAEEDSRGQPQGHSQGHSQPAGIRVVAPVRGAWSDAAAAADPGGAITPQASGQDAAQSTPPSSTGPSGSDAPTLWPSLLMALLGGAILNLMPCVFPVLSLKAFGLAQHAQDRRALALGGLAYSLGVVLSFAALAGVLLALRASGEQLGWGFQLQSPLFVAALALLFTLMGLNLLGLFEFSVALPGRWASAQLRHPLLDQALTGVLAVIVASPCTAPFMGASLGAAVTMPTLQALMVFVALGLGMALPYLLLCLMPAWAARLPRPGPWMLHFRHAMALPMLATVVWLLWVLGHQAGVDALAAMLGLLLATAFAIGAWSLGTRSASARMAFRAVALMGWLLTLSWAWPSLKESPDARGATPSSANAAGAAGPTDSPAWSTWSPDAVRQVHAQGRTVFVDFTAAWCVTCQVNKRSTLADPQVLQAMADRGIVLMRADWTRRDALISQELSRLQRTGVPVYAFYAPGQAPRLLPELLTPGLVLEAVQAVGTGGTGGTGGPGTSR